MAQPSSAVEPVNLNHKRLVPSLLILLALTWSCYAAFAQVPSVITFQGKLTTAQTNPLNGLFNLNFRLYDVETGGTNLWRETHTNTPVSRGIFAVPLGVNTPLNLPFGNPYWISIEVGNDGEMFPRQRLTASPYAVRSKTAETADSAQLLGGASINQLGLVPIGSIIAWAKNLTGVPSLPENFRECNGQVLIDPNSVLNGVSLPDLNMANRFLRGSLTSGTTGGVEQVVLSIDQLPPHNHAENADDGKPAYVRTHSTSGTTTIAISNGARSGVRITTDNTGSGQPVENRPPFYDVIWIIRVK